MTGLFQLREHLIFYKSYHMNYYNVAIHLLCIPLIYFSSVAMGLSFKIFGEEYPYVNVGSLLVLTYGTYFTLLDWTVGLPTFVAYTVIGYYLNHFYIGLNSSASIKPEQFFNYAITVHIASWLAQFYGHQHYEKRAPALFDNLIQALVLAPFFVSFEIAFWLGFQEDLEKEITNKAGKRVLEFRHAQKHKNDSK